MKTDNIFTTTLHTLFVKVFAIGAFSGILDTIRSFYEEHEEQLQDLVQRKETED